jgi:hypothetical protein
VPTIRTAIARSHHRWAATRQCDCQRGFTCDPMKHPSSPATRDHPMHPALAKTSAAHATAQAPSRVNAVASATEPARSCKESAGASRVVCPGKIESKMNENTQAPIRRRGIRGGGVSRRQNPVDRRPGCAP